MKYEQEMMMLANAYKKAFAGVRQTKAKVYTEDLKEMKAKLAEYGYKYMTKGKAYKEANDIGTSNFLKITETDEGYYAVVTIVTKAR